VQQQQQQLPEQLISAEAVTTGGRYLQQTSHSF